MLEKLRLITKNVLNEDVEALRALRLKNELMCIMGEKYAKFEKKSDNVKFAAMFDNFRAEFLKLDESETEQLFAPFKNFENHKKFNNQTQTLYDWIIDIKEDYDVVKRE